MSLVGKLVVVIGGPFEGLRGEVWQEGIYFSTKIPFVSISLTDNAYALAKTRLKHIKNITRDGWVGGNLYPDERRGISVPKKYVEVIMVKSVGFSPTL